MIHRRGADGPVDVIRLHRPVPGDLISCTCAERPSAVLIERDVAKAIEGECGCGRRRWNVTTPQYRVTGLLPPMNQAVVFKVEAQDVRSHLGACRDAQG